MSPLPTTENVTRPQAFGYGARLGSLLVRLVGNAEIAPVIDTIPPEATRVDTGENPEDFVSETGQTFSRSSFGGGEGLGFAHRAGAVSNRFWDSQGVDVSPPQPGDRDAARLLHDVEEIRSATDDNLHLASDGESLWMAEGVTIFRSDDPTDPAPTFSEDDPQSGLTSQSVGGLAVLGDDLYAACGINGVRKRDGAGAWSTHSNLTNATGVWAAKRRVIASNNAELHEANHPSSTLLLTLPPGHRFTDVIDAGAVVLAAADDGSIYAFATSEGEPLDLIAENEIPGEQPTTLAHLGGFVLVGTARPTGDGSVGRLWRGELTEGGNLANLTLLRQWGHGDDIDDLQRHSPSAIAIERNVAYIGVAEHLPGDGGDLAGLWHYSFATGGRSRGLAGAPSDELVADVLSLQGRVFFSVTGSGLLRERLNTFTRSGYLILPAADFFTQLDKAWAEITVDANVNEGEVISVYYSTDLQALQNPNHSKWTKAMEVTAQVGTERAHLGGVTSRYLVLMAELRTSGDRDTTPELFALSVTAVVGGQEVSITVPVNVSDQIELPGRHRHNVRGLGEKVWRRCRELQRKPVTLELFRPRERVRGVVWSVGGRVPAVAGNGTRTLVCNVEVRGRTVPLGTEFAGQGAMGVGLMGHMVMGGVDDDA